MCKGTRVDMMLSHLAVVALIGTAFAVPPPVPDNHNVISNMIYFGDSYTDTHVQYDISNGKTLYTKTPYIPPAPYGYISPSRNSNGPGTVEYFHNATGANIYDYACGCGTTDNKQVTTPCGVQSGLLSIAEMLPIFYNVWGTKTKNGKTVSVEQDPKTSIWVVYIGYNDLSTIYQNKTQYGIDEIVANHYATNVESMYDASARNFLFVTLGRWDLTPVYINASRHNEFAMNVTHWNDQITKGAQAFAKKHPDTKTSIFDMYDLHTRLIQGDLRAKYGFTEFTACNTAPDCNNDGPNIGKYFWANANHPSSKTHGIESDYILQFLNQQGYNFAKK